MTLFPYFFKYLLWFLLQNLMYLFHGIEPFPTFLEGHCKAKGLIIEGFFFFFLLLRLCLMFDFRGFFDGWWLYGAFFFDLGLFGFLIQEQGFELRGVLSVRGWWFRWGIFQFKTFIYLIEIFSLFLHSEVLILFRIKEAFIFIRITLHIGE